MSGNMLEVVYDPTLTEALHARSCARCRERKLKCDRRLPCAQCENKLHACSYPVRDKFGRKSPRSTSSSRKNRATGTNDTETTRMRNLHGGSSAPPESNDFPTTGSGPFGDCMLAPPLNATAVASFRQEGHPGFYQWPEDQLIGYFNHGSSWQTNFDLGHPESESFVFDYSKDTIWPASIDLQLVRTLVDLYFTLVHPSIPVLCSQRMIVEGMISERYTRDRDFAAYLLACCAFMSAQAPVPYKSVSTAKQFLSESIRLYNVEMMGETPTVEITFACLKIFGTLWTLGSVNAAWLRLQETINWTKLLQLEKLETVDPAETVEWQEKIHLLLGLVVIERTFAVGREHRLLLAVPSPDLIERFTAFASHLNVEGRKNAAALRILVESFGQLDDEVLGCWRSKCAITSNTGQCTKLNRPNLAKIFQAFPSRTCSAWQQLLGREPPPIQGLEHEQDFTTNEYGDVLLTCLWVQNRLWHLALTHSLLTMNDSCSFLRLDFAVTLAERTLEVCKSFRISSFEGHGQGLAEKFAHVAADFLDVVEWLQCHSPQPKLPAIPQEETIPPGPPVPLETANLPMYVAGTAQSGNDCQENSSGRERTSHVELATGLLGFFALFNNGQSSHYREYLTRYQKFMSLQDHMG